MLLSQSISRASTARLASPRSLTTVPCRPVPHYRRLRPLRVAEVEQAEAEADEFDACSLLTVIVDNKSDPTYTKLSIDVLNYPSLLRTVAWTLNGLNIRAQNASMKVVDGFSEQVYWLTDTSGNKLTEGRAAAVADRMRQFVLTCLPQVGKLQEEWDEENVFVSNRTHPDFTEFIIKGEPTKSGFFLEVATVMNTIGVTIQEASIQGDLESGLSCDIAKVHDFENKGRIFRFLLSKSGTKLTPGRVAATFFILDLVAGRGYQPLKL